MVLSHIDNSLVEDGEIGFTLVEGLNFGGLIEVRQIS